MDMFKYENKYWNKGLKYIVGIDEAGRGPLAGPVVAACVIIDKKFNVSGIYDSKKVSAKKREQLYPEIIKNAIDVSIGIASEREIDSINILQATFLAMKRALGNLKYKPQQVLIDGPYSNIKIIPVENIIKGDSQSISIAAASIIAKVKRDMIMKEYDLIFSDYAFGKHKGYGTKLHIEAIKRYKATPIHRKSFKIVKSYLPTYDYLLKNKIIAQLGSQYVATTFIKNGYILIEKDINIDSIGEVIDYSYQNDKENIYLKVITKYRNTNYSLGNIVIKDFDDYKLFIEKNIIKKDLKKKNKFNVILIEFFHKKSPLIKVIYDKKNY